MQERDESDFVVGGCLVRVVSCIATPEPEVSEDEEQYTITTIQ